MGWKVIRTWQELEADREPPQLFEKIEKLEGLAPVRVMEVIVKVAVPEFVRVTT